MKKVFSRLRRLSRTKLIAGVFVLAILFGGCAWGLYVAQSSNSNKTLAEVNRSIDKQVADQVSNLELSEKAVVDMSQPGAEAPGSAGASRSDTSSSSSTQTSGVPAPAPSSGGQTNPQKAAPSAESPTSPTYPNDNGDTPQVTLTNPSAWKQVVSGSFTATAIASDSSGINRVVFMLRKIGQAMPVQMITDTEFPYSATIDVSSLPNGDSEYTVEAQAFDNTAKGNLASYRINIQN